MLEQAVHFEPDGQPDAWYLLAMARAADGKWEAALEAAHTYWSKCSKAAESDPNARNNAVAKLLPVLLYLCKHCNKRGELEAVRTVAQLAVEVARFGWDRQTEEQLRDTLSAAAQAATKQDKPVLGQSLRELQQQLAQQTKR